MSFSVFFTAHAIRDLEELYDYIALHDAPGKAERVVADIEKAINRLSQHPKRGAYPKELLALGVRDYREIFFKPYRVIYRIAGNEVFILLIADGRREMQTLLQRRLLEA